MKSLLLFSLIEAMEGVVKRAKDDKKGTHLPTLLPELISEILSRVPIESLMRFTCVSKSWSNLTKHPAFIKLQQSRAQPRIMFVEETGDGDPDTPRTCLYLIDEGEEGECRWKGRDIPIEVKEDGFFWILGSCDGLLCVESGLCQEDPLLIYSPITKECVTLPESDRKHVVTSTGFCFDDKSKKYKVVRLFTDDDSLFYTKGEIITVGESAWRILDVPYAVPLGEGVEPLFEGGALYWFNNNEQHLSGPKQIVVFDIANEKFRTIDFSITLNGTLSLGLAVDGDSLLVVEHSEQNHIRIFKIIGTEVEGYKIQESSHVMSIRPEDCPWGLSYVSYWSKDAVMFQHFLDENKQSFQLAFYFFKKKKYRIVELHGVPNHYDIKYIAPSLVSPSATFATASCVAK
ncbi:hypothetical protein GIB67_039436 [Kingdonia uniflora]|uniref:F-box domain-containing protein n=1 Tax=Kingdonia uniflora TaxID=39325 RepID=A0A7J7LIU0_9MAGN|nr:hypothetical protein GIB67_039436 [Kingdonia uniflora]